MARVKTGARYSARYYKIVSGLTDNAAAKSAAENVLLEINRSIQAGQTPAAAVQAVLGVSLARVQSKAKPSGTTVESNFARDILRGMSVALGKDVRGGTRTEDHRFQPGGNLTPGGGSAGDQDSYVQDGSGIQASTSTTRVAPLLIGGLVAVGLIGYTLTTKSKKGKR